MCEIELKYGNAMLKLEKSPTSVGLRSQMGGEAALGATLARVGARTTQTTLGGFEVVDVESAAQPMEATLDALRDAADVAVGTHVYYASDDRVPFVPTGQVYIEFKQESDVTKCDKLLNDLALEIIESRGEREIVARVTPDSSNPVKVAARLQASDLVDVAEPEFATPGKVSAFAMPADPLLERQWHLRNSGSIDGSRYLLKAGADARVVAAWQRANSLGSRDVIVAVVDDGFDLRHPDLSGPGKIVAPWDFSQNDPEPLPGPPQYDWQRRRWVGDWHGTACAGVAVGNANGHGIVGAAPGCRLMPVRWGSNLADSQLEAWFGHAQRQGASVVSCSWGAAAAYFPLSTRAYRAIERCASQGRGGRGCVVVFAAGNENRDVNSPASRSVNGFAIHPDVIAVAACTSTDKRSNYSNFGREIAICAPSNGAGGRGILTSDVMGTFSAGGMNYEAGYSPGAFTETFGGTSSACPLAAGVCALLLSVKPNLTARDVKRLIQRTARKIGPKSAYESTGHSRQYGYGCIDADSAMRSLVGGNGPAAHFAPKKRRAAKSVRAKR